MAKIRPFHGIRYSPDVVRDISMVVTPPYDVIDLDAQNKYYERHRYNIIRLDYGKTTRNDTARYNKYTRARDYFTAWLEEGVLRREAQPAIYLYEQQFSHGGKSQKRTSFICTVEPVAYGRGGVLPHEDTLPKPKADRLRLLETCQANFSPVFGIYSDRGGIVNRPLLEYAEGHPPEVEFVDDANEIHRLWPVTDETVIHKVQAAMRGRTIYIADGHHRYEVALKYYQHNGTGAGVMMALVNLFDEGLVILPTHRLVRGTGLQAPEVVRKLSEFFEVSDYPGVQGDIAGFLQGLRAAGEAKKTAFGLYGGGFYVAALKEPGVMDRLAPHRSPAWRSLDVSVVHALVIERILGIDPQKVAAEHCLSYTQDPHAAVRRVDEGEYEFALLLNPTRVEQVIEVSRAGDKMPQKSTYFYPKLITGLVINSFARKPERLL